jgi:predicted amidohydrolase YtcJ
MGKLAPGYLADLLVLDRDPFRCEASEPEAIKEIRPLMTMVGGEWIYGELSL